METYLAELWNQICIWYKLECQDFYFCGIVLYSFIFVDLCLSHFHYFSILLGFWELQTFALYTVCCLSVVLCQSMFWCCWSADRKVIKNVKGHVLTVHRS